MIAGRLITRLLAMDGVEVRFRTATTVRREAQRLGYIARRPRWRRAALTHALRADDPTLAETIERLVDTDWIGAHESLMHHFATRPPRFVLDPAAPRERVDAVVHASTTARQDAVRAAGPLLEGRFNLLGYQGLTFSNGCHRSHIDWHFDPVHNRRAPDGFWSRVAYLHPSCGDHKIVWELNRHQYWLVLGRAYWLSGDRRYRDTFVEHFDSWMGANPPLSGMNWASMLELALRGISWVWALHFFAVDRDAAGLERSPWTVDLLIALDRQLTLVEHNLSRYFSPNTHLLGEALALYVVGRTLPELRRAARWERLGRDILVEQIARQINRDGGHAELSTHYHRYTLDFYLLAFAIARQTDDPAAASFGEAVERLARFARTIADDNGRLPGIGDDDGGSLLPICGREPLDVSDSLQLAAQLLDRPELSAGPPAEEVAWITGRAACVPPAGNTWPSAALSESGYFVSRAPNGDHLTIDAGPHGFLNGGHAHADALALTIGVRGRPLLIDPGTGCYTIDLSVRDRFRSTPYHNTITLDGRSQSVPDGPFHWRRVARSTALDWRTEGFFDLFEGAHDGYAPLLHHRTVLARPGCWFVVDRLTGSGNHHADAHWHLDPAWRATRSSRTAIRAEHPAGLTVWILSLEDEWETFHGSHDGSELGWCAPVYGPLVPTFTVRATRSGALPLSMVTVILESSEKPALERVPVTSDGRVAEDAVGFRLSTRSWTETALFTRRLDPAASQRAASSLWTAGGLNTDARVVCWREDAGQPGRAVVLVDGTVSNLTSRRLSPPKLAAQATGPLCGSRRESRTW
jgi:hypothetical protein